MATETAANTVHEIIQPRLPPEIGTE